MKHQSSWTHCRVCGGELRPVINLGDQYLQGSFIKPGRPQPSTEKYPLHLLHCAGACGLAQLAHSFPPDLLYQNYWYRSGVNEIMRDHLGGIVADCQGSSILDIGCNDGTLLNAFPSAWTKVGIDPSDLAWETKPPIKILHGTFPSVRPEGQFDIVTSIAMFYDLDDPIAFARAVKEHLAPNGVWIIEVAYLQSMLANCGFDTICHEHQEYYSLASLEYIMFHSGLRIFDAELNSINGGSIRVHVCHAGERRDTARLRELRANETKPNYREFHRRCHQIQYDLRGLLLKLQCEGKRVHVYGASTKGNVLLQWCNVDHSLVDYAADRNPDKHGASTIGTNIPIISEEQSRRMKPDYYLVLPWHFRSQFLQRERAMLAAGTKFIFPLPELEVVGETGRDHSGQAQKRALGNEHRLNLPRDTGQPFADTGLAP